MIESTPLSVFKTVLIYSLFILLGPIAAFFSVKYFFFEGLIGAGILTTNIWSAVVAVIVLHIALGMFIYKAYFDSGKVKLKPDEKVD